VFGLLERMVADPDSVSAGDIEAVRAPESPTLRSWTRCMSASSSTHQPGGERLRLLLGHRGRQLLLARAL
jgi:hypothetical protein